MLTQERADKLVAILEADEERAVTLLELEPEAALVQINALGNDFTVEELKEFAKMLSTVTAKDEGELDADALDGVAGGAIVVLIPRLKKTINNIRRRLN